MKNNPTRDPVEPVAKLVRVRPGRKYWEVQVLGPSVMSGWMRSAVTTQDRAKVPPQLKVAVAYEWAGYAIAFGSTTITSEYLDEIRYRAEELQAEREEMDCDDGEGSWEVSVPCDGCNGNGSHDCPRCDRTGEVGRNKEKCKVCHGDGQMICAECDGEAFWYVDYEPGLEHWPGPAADWAEDNKEEQHG